MKDRLQQFLELKNISAARLADMLGIQRSAISHILGGRNKPGYDFIYKFLMTFPYVNAEWFITGKGEAIKNLAPLPQPVPKRSPEPLFTKQEQEIRQPIVNEVFDDFPVDDASEEPQNINIQQVSSANSDNTSSVVGGNGGINNVVSSVAAPEINTPPEGQQHDIVQPQRNRKVEKVILLFSDGTYQELK